MSERPSSTDASARSITWVTEWLPLVLLVGGAAYFVTMWSAWSGSGLPAHDIYQYYYPNMLAGRDRLADGGRGLLWNPLLNCGQPFFGIGSVGLLYPANLFFLLLQPDAALRAVTASNLAVGGISAYLLCRYLGLGVTAAFCGALAFELGNITVLVSEWTPLVASSYVWFPAVMLLCERILRAPSVILGLGLAAVLSIALLPGFPQTVAFMYQLVALRVAWEFASRRVVHPSRTLLALSLGLLAPPLLTAVQLLPAIETAWFSVRNTTLGASELGASVNWGSLRRLMMMRREQSNPFVVVPFMLAGASLTHGAIRREAAFYLVAALLFFVLSFGPATPVYELYSRLPLGSLFRMPSRFMWVTGFCLAVLTAFGTEAVLTRVGPVRQEATTSPLWRLGPPLVAMMVTLLIYAFLARGLIGPERILTGLALGGFALGVVAPRARPWMGSAIALALAINLLWFPLPLLGHHEAKMFQGWNWTARPLPFGRMRSGQDLQRRHATVFTALRSRMNPQDRIYSVHQAKDMSFGPKTASFFGAPSIQDYEPQPALRYARYFVLMRTGRKMESFNEIYVPVAGMMPPPFRRRLLDLAAARFLVVDPKVDTTRNLGEPPLTLLTDGPDLRVYENADALPRARFVPRIEVVPDGDALLERLAFGTDDLSQVALVEAPLPSAFTGTAKPPASGKVEFEVNDPEHIRLRVDAPARGFLVLADQHFPGWTATVDGISTPIARANFVFRLVEVPAGTSTVEFRYAPLSVRAGAAISALSVLGAGVLLIHARREARRRKTAVS